MDLKGFGKTFPHPYGLPEQGLYYTQVLIGLLGDQLTADFAKTAIVEEGLGDDTFTDYLSLSFPVWMPPTTSLALQASKAKKWFG